MQVIFDAQIYLSQKAGGISRYHYELLRGLRQINVEASVAGLFIKNQYLFADPHYKRRFINDPSASFAFFNKLLIKNKLRRLSTDQIFHPANPYPFLHSEMHSLPHCVFTIHDMISEQNSRVSGTEKYFYAQQADKIIAVSETTKRDIVRLYNINPDKIEVIYHGCSLSPKMAKKPSKRIPIPDQYILYVGDRNDHKNFGWFIQSIAPLLQQRNDLYLVCAGKRPFSQLEESSLTELSVRSKVIMLTQPSNQELAYLYVNSQLFVFPSLREGFGIPILEAWACQTPVVLSSNDCFTEVAAEAGCYFEPTKQESILGTIEQVLYDKDLQKSLIRKGNQRLALFSWEKSVNQHLQVYQSLL
jgi:glycosyltransferase involved in cell wall biosynthesis